MIHKFQTIRLSFLEFQSLANVNIFLQFINTALNTTPGTAQREGLGGL